MILTLVHYGWYKKHIREYRSLVVGISVERMNRFLIKRATTNRYISFLVDLLYHALNQLLKQYLAIKKLCQTMMKVSESSEAQSVFAFKQTADYI